MTPTVWHCFNLQVNQSNASVWTTTACSQSQNSCITYIHTTEYTLLGDRETSSPGKRWDEPHGEPYMVTSDPLTFLPICKHLTDIRHRRPTDHGVQVTIEGVSAGDDQGELTTSQQAEGAHLSQTVCSGAEEWDRQPGIIHYHLLLRHWYTGRDPS